MCETETRMNENLTCDEIDPHFMNDKTLAVEEIEDPSSKLPPPPPPETAFEALPHNVALLNCDTVHDIPIERILQGALEAKLTEVVIVGFTEDGCEYLASSTADISRTLTNLARGLHHTQRTCDECFELSSNVRPAK